MKSKMTEEPKMETRVLMPNEMSLVVMPRPLPPLDRLLPLEDSIKICATKKLLVGTRYFAYSGTVIADELPLLSYLPPFDIRSRHGGYDTTDIRMRRNCNWVRFLKISPMYNHEVNLIGRKFGPSNEDVEFEVVRDVPTGSELIAYLLPETPSEDAFLLPALQILRSSFYKRKIDSIMADAPLDLSRSLFTSPKTTPIAPTTVRKPAGDSDGHSSSGNEDSSPIPSPSSHMSLSPPPSQCPTFPSSTTMPFLPLPFPSPAGSSLFTSAHLLATGIPRVSPPTTIPTPPSSVASSPTGSTGSPTHIPVAPPKRRERTMLPCSECGKAFDRPSLLKRHMRTHTGEKPHVCDVCGKGFSTSSSLNTHRRIHSGEKPHQCTVCGKRFTASSNLYYHRMTHTKEKPHKCSLCTRSFPTPGDLRSHMFVHNGQWPHKCNVCGKGFSKSTNLRNHSLLHSAKGRTAPTPPSSRGASPITGIDSPLASPN